VTAVAGVVLAVALVFLIFFEFAAATMRKSRDAVRRDRLDHQRGLRATEDRHWLRRQDEAVCAVRITQTRGGQPAHGLVTTKTPRPHYRMMDVTW
jgi:hypothetical protein